VQFVYSKTMALTIVVEARVPLAETSVTKGLNVDDVIASLEAVIAPSSPETKVWTEESLASPIAYIVDAHHAYVNREVPRLNELAAKVVNQHGETHQELPATQSKLAELGEELIAHQRREEVVVFPCISKLERFITGGGAKPRN